MKRDFCSQGAGRDIVCAAEGGEEVIECVLIGYVDSGQDDAPVPGAVGEEIAVSDGEVEEAAGFDAGRVMVIVAGAGSGDVHQF